MTITTEEAERLARSAAMADWSGVPIGNKAIIHKMVNDLRTLAAERDAAIARAEKAEAEAGNWLQAFSAQSGKLQAVLHIPGVKETLRARAALNQSK